MDSQTIIDNARLDAGVDEYQVTDTNAVTYLNRVYRDLINNIRKIDEDYFFNTWTQNLVSGTNVYGLDRRTSSVPGIVKIKTVSIKYNSTDDFRKARPEVSSNLEKDLTWYEEHQPITDPFYIVADESVYIYPKPTNDVTNGYKVEGISDPCDLDIDSTEDDVKIPIEYHEIIGFGMVYHIFRGKNMINEKNDAKNEYETEKQKMLSVLSDRIVGAIESTMPYIGHLG